MSNGFFMRISLTLFSDLLDIFTNGIDTQTHTNTGKNIINIKILKLLEPMQSLHEMQLCKDKLGKANNKRLIKKVCELKSHTMVCILAWDT